MKVSSKPSVVIQKFLSNMTDALSIQEANRLRAALGLQPLPVPTQDAAAGLKFGKPATAESQPEVNDLSTHDKRIAASTDNWQKLEDEREAKLRKEARREEIRKAKEKAAKSTILQGRGLGEPEEDEELDTRTWLKQQRKRQKQISEEHTRRQQELDQAQNSRKDYEGADLAGIKVEHEVQDFEGGEDHILTLKDATIDELDNEGDVLEDQSLQEKAILKDKLDRKKKKPVYDVHEEAASGQSRILGQYDEEIGGKQRKNFTLDSRGFLADTQVLLDELDYTTSRNQKLVSLETIKNPQKPDYLKPSEIKIRKPKKKSKSSRKRELDDDESAIVPVPIVGSFKLLNDDQGPTAKRTWAQSSLATEKDHLMGGMQAKDGSSKRRKKMTPEDIARQILEDEEGNKDDIDDLPTEGALVIDETTEFLTGLQKPQPRLPKAAGLRTTGSKIHAQAASQDTHDDTILNDGSRSLEDSAERKIDESEPSRVGIEEEASLGSVAETLALLRGRQMISSSTTDLNAQDRSHAQLLAAKAKLAQKTETLARQQRERDRTSNRHSALSSRDAQSQAQHENVLRGQAESRQLAEIFEREYRPEVELRHTDEFGRKMGQKEAFKHLSHQFHGKGSGKGKTEKRLKRIQAEREREARSTLDVSGAVKEGGGGGMIGAQGGQAKKMGTAGVRLA